MLRRFRTWLLVEIYETLSHIVSQLNKFDMKLSEALAALSTIKDTLAKAKGEILSKIEALNSTDPDISPEGQATIDQLKAVADALDAIVPDVTPTA